MILGHIEIFVSNPLKAKSFYTEILGFEELVIQANQFVWLKLGSTEILLRPHIKEAIGFDYSQRPVLVLYTDDLVKTKASLENKGLVFKGTDGSDKCLTFDDEDGNWFQLVDPNDH